MLAVPEGMQLQQISHYRVERLIGAGGPFVLFSSKLYQLDQMR